MNPRPPLSPAPSWTPGWRRLSVLRDERRYGDAAGWSATDDDEAQAPGSIQATSDGGSDQSGGIPVDDDWDGPGPEAA